MRKRKIRSQLTLPVRYGRHYRKCRHSRVERLSKHPETPQRCRPRASSDEQDPHGFFLGVSAGYGSASPAPSEAALKPPRRTACGTLRAEIRPNALTSPLLPGPARARPPGKVESSGDDWGGVGETVTPDGPSPPHSPWIHLFRCSSSSAAPVPPHKGGTKRLPRTPIES